MSKLSTLREKLLQPAKLYHGGKYESLKEQLLKEQKEEGIDPETGLRQMAFMVYVNFRKENSPEIPEGCLGDELARELYYGFEDHRYAEKTHTLLCDLPDIMFANEASAMRILKKAAAEEIDECIEFFQTHYASCLQEAAERAEGTSSAQFLEDEHVEGIKDTIMMRLFATIFRPVDVLYTTEEDFRKHHQNEIPPSVLDLALKLRRELIQKLDDRYGISEMSYEESRELSKTMPDYYDIREDFKDTIIRALEENAAMGKSEYKAAFESVAEGAEEWEKFAGDYQLFMSVLREMRDIAKPGMDHNSIDDGPAQN